MAFNLRNVFIPVIYFALLITGVVAQAFESTIKIDYKSSPANPNPGWSTTQGQLPMPLEGAVREIFREHPDPIQRGIYFSWPAQRQVTLTSPSGHKVNASVKMISVAHALDAYDSPTSIYDILSFRFGLEGNCTVQRLFTSSGDTMYVAYDINVENQPTGGYCNISRWRTDRYPDLNSYKFQYKTRVVYPTAYTYEVILPPATEFESNLYRGSVSYSVGESADLSYGPMAYPVNAAQINIEVDVQHSFTLRFPPQADNVYLRPADNWHSWLANNIPPKELAGSVPFIFSGHSAVKFYLQCPMLDNCHIGSGIPTDGGWNTPVAISITIPGATVSHSGAPVVNTPLATLSTNALSVIPGKGTVSGSLHFKLAQNEVKQLMTHHSAYGASRFSGTVILIAEAELN